MKGDTMNDQKHYCIDCEAEYSHEKWLKEYRESYHCQTEGRCESCDEAYADGYDPVEAYFG